MASESADLLVTPDVTKSPKVKVRRNSAGNASSGNGDEKVVPNYVRASTGSCHDLCKYGREHGFASKERRSIPNRATRKKLHQSSEESIGRVIVKSKPPVDSKPTKMSTGVLKESVNSKPTKMSTVVLKESVDSKTQIPDALDTNEHELPSKSFDSQKHVANEVKANRKKTSSVEVKPSLLKSRTSPSTSQEISSSTDKELIKELGAPVEYIVLPTFAYEHKIFVGPFSRKFPRAQVWVAPRQWSWPLNLPLEFFGIFRAKTLKDEDLSTPWAGEIEQKVLSSPEVGIGPYVEVAFYHKPSRTLLVTDAVIFVPKQPPECINKESLLASAKNGLAVKILSKGREVPDEPVIDNKRNLQKGWERMVLQILFLGPSNLLEPNASFEQMSEKLIVSPIVKTLVFSKVPEKVRDWVDSISRDWKFRRIIPAHFAAPINVSRSDFRTAFAFLDEFLGDRYDTWPSLSLLFSSIKGKAASYFPPDDMRTLSSLDQFLVSVGAVKKTVSGRKR